MNYGVKTLVIWFCLFCLQAHAENWPEFPIPKNERAVIVGNQIAVNGLTMKIMEMTSKSTVSDIIEFYKKAWEVPVKKDAPGYIVNEVNPYTIISRAEKDFLMTIQVKKHEKKGSYSLLAISNVQNERVVSILGKGFPKMNTTEVLSDIKSQDIYQEGRTLIMENSFSVQSNINFYRDYYLKRGWNDITQGQVSSTNMAVMIMNKNKHELNLTFNRAENRTHIVAVAVTR
tara:strand:+ start:3749 stop:4438 length:690 start_codon:yes stop_codon:yes gene_type:complete